MFKSELQLKKTFLKKFLNKKFIVFNFAFFVSLILFVKKANKKLKFCVNYQRLNVTTQKNCSLLLFILKLTDRFLKFKIFIKINIKYVFSKIKIIIKRMKILQYIKFVLKFVNFKYYHLYRYN